MTLPKKVVVITGGTSGIGLNLLERLLLETRLHFLLRICILCRNMKKGEFVRSTLLLHHNSAEIELVKMDTGDMRSVLDAVGEIKNKYFHIDYLFLNAGICPIKRLNFMGFFSREFLERLRTGDMVVEVENPINELGIPTVFATNILGHFMLFQELIPLLKCKGKSTSQIIWTTSKAALRKNFSMEDFVCKHGPSPYGSSKYIMNGVSLMINQHHSGDRIYSSLAEPGACFTQLFSDLMPGYFWKIAIFILQFLRLFASHLCLSAYNGAGALLWLFKQDPRNLERNYEYHSCVNVFGQAYVTNTVLEIAVDEAEEMYGKLCEISRDMKNVVQKT